MHNRPPQSKHDTAPRRSATSTLEMLDDALSKLEQRIGIDAAQKSGKRDEDISAIRARQEALARNTGAQRHAPPSAGGESALHSEIARMREELNREMSSTIAQQFAAIREDLKSIVGQAGATAPDLSDGFNRLTRELGVVASRVENSDMGSLRSEVEELRSQVAALAREDTLRDMAERWSVIEREIGELPQSLGSREDLLTIAARITEMQDALQAMPGSRAFGAMEDQMRALAEAVESLASQNASVSPDHLQVIDRRLDEISRAIASVSVPGGPVELDTTPFDRIEARLSALARQVEEGGSPAQSESVEKRLMEITDRLGALHEAISAAPAAGDTFDNVAARLEDIARRIDAGAQQPAESIPSDMLENFNARFAEIAQRLDSQQTSAEETGARLFESIDARMEELARRIEENERDATHVPTFEHMERRIEEIAQMLSAGDGLSPVAAQPDTAALQGIEAQIAALSEKLSATPPSVDNEALADLAPRLLAITDQLAGGRDDMIAAAREAAEEVIGRYSSGATDEERGVLSQLAGDLRGLEELSRDSDDRNARTFEAIHDTLVKVADRIAGLESSLRGGAAPAQAEYAPRQPWDEPSTAAEYDSHDEPDMSVRHVENAPPLDFAEGEDRGEPDPQPDYDHDGPEHDLDHDADRQSMTPAQAAALAARAAVEDKDEGMDELAGAVAGRRGETAKGQRGILAGLRNAMSRGSDTAPAPQDEPEEPVVFGKAEEKRSDLADEDEPLEPGSGGPDLAEIMKRVRAEREGNSAQTESHSAEDDAGKSDFIAAARRAARAAAAESSVYDGSGAGEDGRGKSKSGGILAASRRPLMLGAGAILLALLAFPLVRGYLPGGAPADDMTRLEEPAPAAVEPAPAEEPEAMRVIESADRQAAAQDGPAQDGPAQAETQLPPAEPVETAQADVPAPAAPQDTAEVPADETVVPADETQIAAEDMAAEEAGVDETIQTSGFEALTLDDVPASAGPLPLREAAAEGDPMAMFVVGDRLMGTGPGAPDSDMEAAAEWYEMAAELGYAPAQYRIGNAYEKAFGVERDLEAAMTWYQLAAEQGNVSAMHNLAVLFATEVNGSRDMDSAARWFLEAAELGVKDSQVNLGILAARGEGVPQDLVESYKWLALAAAAGDTDAEAKRDEVAKYMRPDQLETAKGAVELWKPRTPDPAVNAIDIPEDWKVDDATTASTPASANAAPQVDMDKAIRNIQAILNNAGFDAGPPDGIMGDKTRTAISEFQKANGLLPTGEVDRALVDKLLEINQQG